MKSTYCFSVFSFCLFLLIATTAKAQSLNPLVVGTIHPGDSVVIYYDVTINTGAGAQVANQGTISGSDSTALVTDDPDTAPLGDPTITPLNVFPLPVTLYAFSAAPVPTGVELAWNVAAESGMLHYEVEKSTDGRTFSKIGEGAAQNNGQPVRYRFLDRTVGNGTLFYRLKLVEFAAVNRYSAVVKVDLAGKVGNVTVFPNPAQKQITLQLNNLQNGSYQLEFYNSAGQPVFSRSVQHDGGSQSRGISLPEAITPGVYFVKIRSEQVVYSQALIVR